MSGSPSPWKGRRVVVTGGAGFIGANLVARLVREGAEVRVADNLERGNVEYLRDVASRIDFRKLDLRETAVAGHALEGMDTVIHLAAKVSGIGVYMEHPGSILLNNLLIDQHVIAAALRHHVPHFFYASSSHVYPEHLQQSVDAPALKEEDAYPALPGLTYGWAKLMGEVALMGLAKEESGMHVSIARICGAYGFFQQIDLPTGSLIPVLCHRAVRWPQLKPFRLRGTGKEKRAYCFVEDVVAAIMRCVEQGDHQSLLGPVNVSTEEAVSVHEIAEAVVRVSGKDIPIEYDPSVATPLWSQTVNCAKAHRELGWKPAVALEEGIRRTYGYVEKLLKAAPAGL